MSSEPSYPQEAAVGDEAAADAPAKLNETLNVAMTAKEAQAHAGKPKNNARSFVKGAAVGVGSAALVAALLYANRSRGKDGDKTDNKTDNKSGD